MSRACTPQYGSKLVALYPYLSDLVESDPNPLPAVPRPLRLYLLHPLRAKIKHARVSGNVFKRQAALTQFATSKDARIIMLRSDDRVSGINLPQPTHVFLLHPFHPGQGEAVDLAWEGQGICRAYRSGLEHPLKVVRYAVEGTIEKGLTLKRQDKH